MKRKYKAMMFSPSVVPQQAAAVPLEAVRPPRPVDLPRIRQAAIALIDVDNIVIGRDGRVDAGRARAALAEVYAQLSGVELSLAVVSETARAALGPDLCFEFREWTWRTADAGRDAADHQLCDFARAALAQRAGARVAIASGDHMFADLAGVTDIEVVVPRGHRGVARALRPYLRVRRAARRRDYDLAT